MRSTTISVHNNQTLEIFAEKRKNGFELWVTSPIKGNRLLLDHHLTHDDLEAHLEYAKPGDLLWREAAHSELPTEKHHNAIKMEETIKRRTFLDYDNPKLDEMEVAAGRALGFPPWQGSHRSVASHLSSIALLANDREGTIVAKRLILGQWTDGVVTLRFEADHRFRWICTDSHDPLNLEKRAHGYSPDWWNFAMWGIALLNQEHKHGTVVGVLRVDEDELHLNVGVLSPLHRIARIFKRVGQPAGTSFQKPQIRASRQKKTSLVAGVATPLLTRLDRAIARRNPLLAQRLKDGLPELDIRAALNKAKVTGAIEPIIELYSWRNGTALDEQTPMAETSFFPEDIYQFMDLEAALDAWRTMNRAAATLRGMFQDPEAHSLFSGITCSLFPLLTDGATGTIAVDLAPTEGKRVVIVEFESTEPVRQVYVSFEEFLKDAIRANREDDTLACFRK